MKWAIPYCTAYPLSLMGAREMGKKFESRQAFHAPLIGIRLNVVHYAILKTVLRINRVNSNELKEEIHKFLEFKKYKTRSGRTQLTHQYFHQCITELSAAHFVQAEENRKPYYYEVVPEFKEKLYNLIFIIDQIERMQYEIAERIKTDDLEITPAIDLPTGEKK